MEKSENELTFQQLFNTIKEKEDLVNMKNRKLQKHKKKLVEATKQIGDLKKKDMELQARDTELKGRVELDKKLDMKLLEIEMSAHALKKKEEIHKRCIETEKCKLQEKAIELKLKEEELLGGASLYKKIKVKK